jgi:hypothetical protein
MIIKLFSPALLVVPTLAYGENPSADLSVQIVPTGKVFACDIGPDYLGSIPAPAQAAGFTHCAANYDFTSTSNFTYNGNTINFSNITTWLDCAGAPSPLWFNVGYGGTPATPCSRYSIVSDGGLNALHLVWTQGDSYNSQATFMSIGSNAQLFGSGVSNSMPLTHYAETKFRSTSATLGAIPGTSGTADVLNFGGFKSYAPWNAWINWDTVELFSPYGNGAGGCNTYWAGGDDFPCATVNFQTIDASFNPGTNYYAFGELTKSDGVSRLSKCEYLSGAPVDCTSWNANSTAISQGLMTTRNYWSTGVGDLNRPSVRTPAVNEEMFIRQISFWVPPTCTWQTQQCNVTVP